MPGDALLPDATSPIAAPAVPAAATTADIQRIEARVEQVVGALGEFGKGVQKGFQDVVSRIPEKPAPQAAAIDGNDLALKIMENPKLVMDEHFLQQSRAHFGPSLSIAVDALYRLNTDAEVKRFDAVYGEGTYDQHIRPEVEQQINSENLPREARASDRVLRALINNVKGEKFDELVALKGKTEEARKVKDREAAPQNVIDFSRRAPTREALSPDDNKFMDEVEERGGDIVDRKDVLSARKLYRPGEGYSVEAWLAAKKAGGKK